MKIHYHYFETGGQHIDTIVDVKVSNNLIQQIKIPTVDFATFPDRRYLKSKIEVILAYSNGMGLSNKIIDDDKKDITVDELMDKYYSNPEAYFDVQSDNRNTKTDTEIDYATTYGSDCKLNETAVDSIKEIESKQELNNNLFVGSDRTILLVCRDPARS